MPKQASDEPIDKLGGPASKEDTQSNGGALPKSGDVVAPSAMLLPADALLLESGALGYAVLRCRG